MGLFMNSSPFDADVEKATNEKHTTEDWEKIMEICDRVGKSPLNAKDCLRSIVKRLNSQDPHIVIQALTLLDACASNCGKVFHLEIASRDFENDLKKLINHPQPKIAEKTRMLLKKWAEGDFKDDRQLNLIPSLYDKLRSEGHDFTSFSDTPRRLNVLNKDPNVVTNSQEEADIAKAIELSLKENKPQSSSSHGSPASKKNNSLYPNVSSALASSSASEGRKVRALYDFEAAEDNELTFLAGEIINILDDSDQNWWKGSNHRGEGLFPANFVTADLSVEPEQFTKLEHSNKKLVQFAEEVEVKTLKKEPEVIEVEIDEKKMDRLLHLLHEADPQCESSSDPQEMLDLEEQVTAMGPLIDAALEKVDRRHAQLTQLSSDLVEALNMYHTLMRDVPPQVTSSYPMPKIPPHMAGYPFQNQAPPPPSSHMYNGMATHYQPPPFPPGSGPSPYNPNMTANNEYMAPTSMPNMSLPQHYQMPPVSQQPLPGSPLPRHLPPGHPQSSGRIHQECPPRHPLSSGHLSQDPSMPPGFPSQSGSMAVQYGPAGSTGSPMNKQSQHML